jgi:lipoprotein-anchoring transpeptidase ErfK/SrfK
VAVFFEELFCKSREVVSKIIRMPEKSKVTAQPAKASTALAKAAKAPKSANKTAAKAAVKAPAIKRKTVTTKIPPAKKSSPIVAEEPNISSDQIALRAYYIAERRRSMGWGGDDHSDWIEAESQLKAEAKRKRLRD